MVRPTATDVVDEMFARPDEEGVSLALVAIRGGEVIAERYGRRPANELEPPADVTAETTLLSWSMAKSFTHAGVGLLVVDGLIDVDAPAPVPEWAGTDKEGITLLQLLEMRSGLRFTEDYVDGDTSHCIEMLFGGTDPSFGHYAAALPLDHVPGSTFNYSSGTSNIVARIVGDVVAGGPGGDAAHREAAVTEFLSSRLFGPVGMTSAIPKFDDAGDFVGSSYVYATARDFARFGELYLHDGVTRRGVGERILPEGWRDHARTRTGHDPDSGLDYGRHFWLWPAFPGSFASHGYEGQFVVVFPDRDLVLVHLGKTDIAHSRGLQMRLARLAELL
jgi:CubicO group peptidase (beta-lactamase class C family)